MIAILKTVGFSVLYTEVFYLLFIAYTAAAANWDRLQKVVKVMLIIPFLIGYAMDVVFNATIGTVLFLGLPNTWTFTLRMAAYKAGPPGWRKTAATWICANLLDVFQQGHC